MSYRSLDVLESSLFHLRISVSSLKRKVRSKELDSIQLKNVYVGFQGGKVEGLKVTGMRATFSFSLPLPPI